MRTNFRRFIRNLTLIVIAFLLAGFTRASVDYRSLHLPSSPACYNSQAYLELSIEPSYALSNSLVTLNIAYHRIGMPYTGILIDRPDLVSYDPPLSMPCKYNEHINHCTAITLRTQATGVVHFTAGAYGEIFGEDCQCFCWAPVQDNGPATLVIANTIAHSYLPSVHR